MGPGGTSSGPRGREVEGPPAEESAIESKDRDLRANDADQAEEIAQLFLVAWICWLDLPRFLPVILIALDLFF